MFIFAEKVGGRMGEATTAKGSRVRSFFAELESEVPALVRAGGGQEGAQRYRFLEDSP